MSDQNETQESGAAATATTPLLPPEEPEAKVESTTPARSQSPQPAPQTPAPASPVAQASEAPAPESQPAPAPAAPVSPAKQRPVSAISNPPATIIANEYKFVHQRIPAKEGKLRFLLPVLLLGFQVVFIVLFAIFGNYANVTDADKATKNYSRK